MKKPSTKVFIHANFSQFTLIKEVKQEEIRPFLTKQPTLFTFLV